MKRNKGDFGGRTVKRSNREDIWKIERRKGLEPKGKEWKAM